MKKPTVYLETSFINRLADPLKRDPLTRQQQLDSRTWWHTYRNLYALVTSGATLDECLRYPNPRIVKLRLRYLAGAACPGSPSPTTRTGTRSRTPRRQPHRCRHDHGLPVSPHLEPKAHR